jgi:hypothetical protein
MSQAVIGWCPWKVKLIRTYDPKLCAFLKNTTPVKRRPDKTEDTNDL